MIWLFFAAALGLLGFEALYREWLNARRLRALVETTTRWAAGDFSVRSSLASQRGEVGRLGRALNAMVESLEHHLLEHKQAERRERQRVVELDRAYRRLQHAQAQLIQSEKLSTIGRMASGIVHEVKNPLGIVLGCVGLLEHPLTPEDLAKTSEAIKEAVYRADRVIHGLLTLSRPSPVQLAPGNVHEAIAAALVLLEPQLAQHRIRLVRALMDQPPLVLINANQIQQVLINLITNAQHATPRGGQVTIRTAVEKLDTPRSGVGRRATDRLKLGAEVFICEVRDTGRGIPPHQLDKIFEPFFTTKPPEQGTGLGLAIVQGIIEQHGGLVGVDSVEGQGTTMRIILPLPPASPPPPL